GTSTARSCRARVRSSARSPTRSSTSSPTRTPAPSATGAARGSTEPRGTRLAGALPFPGVEQLLDVPPLLVAELEAGEEPAGLGDVVVLDRGLEMLAHRDRLPQLPPQPTEEAHLRRLHRITASQPVADARGGGARPRGRTER